jgi:hypothetical protein
LAAITNLPDDGIDTLLKGHIVVICSVMEGIIHPRSNAHANVRKVLRVFSFHKCVCPEPVVEDCVFHQKKVPRKDKKRFAHPRMRPSHPFGLNPFSTNNGIMSTSYATHGRHAFGMLANVPLQPWYGHVW